MLERCKELQIEVLTDLNPFSLSPKVLVEFGKTLGRAYNIYRPRELAGDAYAGKIMPKIKQKMVGFLKVLPEMLKEGNTHFPPPLQIAAYKVLQDYENLLSAEDRAAKSEDLSKEFAAMREAGTVIDF